MNPAVERLNDQLVALTPGERVELAHSLLSSFGPDDDGVEAAWDEEASRHVNEIRSGHAAGRPVEELLTELREHL